MEAYLDWQNKSGGIKLNDVIEDYKYVAAGKQIKAGDLVSYINGIASKVDYGESVDTQLSTQTNSGYVISAVQLDENRVFVVHSYGSNNYLYGIVVTIDGATITYGVDKAIDSTSGVSAGKVISAVKLDNNRVFIAHYHYTSSTPYLYGVVCTIDGTTISAGGTKKLSSNGNSASVISAVKLPNGDVFVAHSYGSSQYLYGVVCTINATTITVGTDTALVSSSNAGSTISTCLLPNGNVFIAHSYDSNYYLYGIVCSISGTTITIGSDTQLSSTSNSGRFISTCLLPNGNVFISHSHTANSYYLYGIVCSISGTTITKGTDTELNGSTTHTGSCIKTQLLPSGAVLIIHSYSSSKYLAGMVAAIDGTVITKGTDTVLINNVSHTGGEISALLLDNGSIFVTHRYDSSNMYLYAQIFAIDENNVPTNQISITEYEQQVMRATEPPFNAVALSSGVGGTDTEHNEQVKIARVYKEVVVTKTGNIFPISGWNEEVANTKYSTNDGYVLEASTSATQSSDFPVYQASDGTTSTWWRSGNLMSSWIKIKLPAPTKITKMKTYINEYSSGTFTQALIQGSNDDSTWTTLSNITSIQSKLTEIVLNDKVDYYQFYRIKFNLSSSSEVNVMEWQTSEYIEKEVIQ